MDGWVLLILYSSCLIRPLPPFPLLSSIILTGIILSLLGIRRQPAAGQLHGDPGPAPSWRQHWVIPRHLWLRRHSDRRRIFTDLFCWWDFNPTFEFIWVGQHRSQQNINQWYELKLKYGRNMTETGSMAIGLWENVNIAFPKAYFRPGGLWLWLWEFVANTIPCFPEQCLHVPTATNYSSHWSRIPLPGCLWYTS